MDDSFESFDSVPEPAAVNTPLSDLVQAILQGKLLCRWHATLKEGDVNVYLLQVTNKACTIELFPPSMKVVGMILYVEGGTISFTSYETMEELWGDMEEHMREARGD